MYLDHCRSVAKSRPTLQPHRLWPTRLLCPWNSPGKNTGVGCRALLRGIFLTQGLNLSLLYLLHWQLDSLLPMPPGNPHYLPEFAQIHIH